MLAGCGSAAAIATTTVLDLYWRDRDNRSVSRHTPSSYKMKQLTIIFACAAASIHALTAPPQLQDLKSNLKLKLRKQQLLRATASQNVTTPRRYASRAELKDTLISELQPNPFHWTEWPFRIGLVGRLLFELSIGVAGRSRAGPRLPPPNPTEGGYFFSLMSIVFGTLTASTISDATARLAALRAAAVEECTLMLPLIKRLEVILVLDSDAPERGDDVLELSLDVSTRIPDFHTGLHDFRRRRTGTGTRAHRRRS